MVRLFPGRRPDRGRPTARPAALPDALLGATSGHSAAPNRWGGRESTIPPISAERIVNWLGANNYHYFVDDEGDVGGLWNTRLFSFFLYGDDSEILQVRGTWNREISIERIAEVLEFCNEWNGLRVWPKAFARVRDDGMVHLVAEVSTDLEHGVNDDQLDHLMRTALGAGNAFFDAVDDLYPDPAAEAP